MGGLETGNGVDHVSQEPSVVATPRLLKDGRGYGESSGDAHKRRKIEETKRAAAGGIPLGEQGTFIGKIKDWGQTLIGQVFRRNGISSH